jgi:hypothetical protein
MMPERKSKSSKAKSAKRVAVCMSAGWLMLWSFYGFCSPINMLIIKVLRYIPFLAY